MNMKNIQSSNEYDEAVIEKQVDHVVLRSIKIYHIQINEDDADDTCSVNINNQKNLNQLSQYY